MNVILSRVSLPLKVVVPAEAICAIVSRWQKSLVPPKMRGWLNTCMCIRNHSNVLHTCLGGRYERAALPRNFNSQLDLNSCCQNGCYWLPEMQLSEFSVYCAWCLPLDKPYLAAQVMLVVYVFFSIFARYRFGLWGLFGIFFCFLYRYLNC